MQVKWLFPSWLFELLPSFLLPSQLKASHSITNSSSSSCISSRILIDQQSKSVLKSHFNFPGYPLLGNSGLGGAWTAAVQAAVGVLPWIGISEISREGQRPEIKRSNHSNQARKRAYRLSNRNCHISGQGGASLVYIRFFSAIFGRLLKRADPLCFPAVLGVSTAIMPPLENSPPKLVPHVDVLEEEDPDSKIPIRQGVTMDQVGEVQNCQIECGLKVDTMNDMVLEPKTGFKFPMVLSRDICLDQTLDASTQVLAGVGIKSLTLVKLKSIKIYAFGFYIKPDGLKAQLGEKYGLVSPEELKHKACFYEDLLRRDLEMTVRLVVHYKGLKTSMVRSAFDTSLKNRLKKIKGVEDDEGLHIFNSYFSESLSLSRGTVIDFQWLPGGCLRTEVDGRLLGTIYSQDLCRAFFDIYIGDPPVSLKAKQDIGEKLGHMLRMIEPKGN